MTGLPLWAKPERKTLLVRLFLDSGGFCVYGHRPCPTPEAHHYAYYIEPLIADWQADDRAQREAEWQALRRRIHGLQERGPLRGQFNAIGRDIFYAGQPAYYLEGLGISGLTFKPFANIRLASSYLHLHVELGDTLKAVSKSRRRKALRYGKALPQEVQERVEALCRKAVEHWLAHR